MNTQTNNSQVDLSGLDTPKSGATRPAEQPMLATINFVGTMLVNGNARVWYRQKYLTLEHIKGPGHCQDCKTELAPGALVAVGINWWENSA